MQPETRALIDALELQPHPEGGHYRETFRSKLTVSTAGGPRAASTAIYFLLPEGVFSAWHVVRSDEVWHHYGGAPLALHTLDASGATQTIVLGPDLHAGQQPQFVVPAGVLQAATPLAGPHTLCGCTVAPGFDFADFAMPDRATLLSEFPAHRDLVLRFTR